MKKILKTVAKILIGFISLVLIYLITAYCLSQITIEKEATTKQEIDIYILTNVVHTDLVVPVRSEIYDWSNEIKFDHTIAKDTSCTYLAMGWGDKGFYLETPQWKDLKASVACKVAFGLSTTAIHATYYKTMTVDDNCKKITISQEQYQRLINYINNSFQKDADGHCINIKTNAVYGENDAFYEANGHYSMLRTCNTWANSGLKASGQRCCLWTPFDKPIFSKYE